MRFLYAFIKSFDYKGWMGSMRVWPPEEMSISVEWDPNDVWIRNNILNDPAGIAIIHQWHVKNAIRMYNWAMRIATDCTTVCVEEPAKWVLSYFRTKAEVLYQQLTEEGFLYLDDWESLMSAIKWFTRAEDLLGKTENLFPQTSLLEFYGSFHDPLYVATWFNPAVVAFTYVQLLVIIFVVLWNIDQIRPFTVADYSPAMSHCYRLILIGTSSMWIFAYLNPHGHCASYEEYLIVQTYSAILFTAGVLGFPLYGIYFAVRAVLRTAAHHKEPAFGIVLEWSEDLATDQPEVVETQMYGTERPETLRITPTVTAPPPKTIEAITTQLAARTAKWAQESRGQPTTVNKQLHKIQAKRPRE